MAALLGFRESAVAYILHRLDPDVKYESFEIKKKSGGTRQIDAPIPQLKRLQKHLANLLSDCNDEIHASFGHRRLLAHGFQRDHSIISNASVHKCRRYVFNVDIEDFFPSFNFGRVRGFFIKNKHFELNPSVATAISQIACYKNGLPQGSPCSPIISNLLTHILDVRMASLAKANGCTYTRYADDLTFSTNAKVFPNAIATTSAEGETWSAGADLTKIVERSGFLLNHKKTRMHYRSSRQLVTGLVVNKKVNIKREYWRAARSMCNSLFRHRFYFRPSIYNDMPPKDGTEPASIKSVHQLEGILNHIYHVRDSHDPRPANEKRKNPNAATELYRTFLFFKHFAALNRPLVVCEGKTDNIYLRCALRSLASSYPDLIDLSGDKPEYRVGFLRPSRVVHEVMKLGSGSSDLQMLIRSYSKETQRFKGKMPHPVIVVIDNDDGAKEIFSAMRASGKVEVSMKSTDSFYYICRNLYVIKTPELPPDSKSCIEDLFPPNILATLLEGKSLNLKKEHESPTEYGKQVFAERVIAPNVDSINFDGFRPLLDRIRAVILDHLEKA